MTKLNWDFSVLENLKSKIKICFSTKKEKDMRIPAKQELCAGSMDGTCGEK
jgi:hypothetical protein